MTLDNQDELLIVVDENDNVLSYSSRKLVHEQKLLHRTISVSVYNDKGQILLQKRSMNKDNNPGKLAGAVGGHVSKDKKYKQAAQEELKEELGINSKLIFIKKMILNDPVHKTMTSLYKIFSNGPFKINKDETDEIKFYSKEDLEVEKENLSESARIVLKEQGLI